MGATKSHKSHEEGCTALYDALLASEAFQGDNLSSRQAMF